MNVLLILIILFSIAIHECGHVVVARLLKFNVSELGIGIGFNLFKVNIKNVTVKFNLIPVGGYSKIEDIDIESSNRKDTFQRNLKKILVFSAGVIINFIFAFILLCCITASFKGIPIKAINEEVTNNNPNLKVGTIIKQIDNQPIKINDDKNRIINENITVVINKQTKVIHEFNGKTLNQIGIYLEKDTLLFRVNNATSGIRNLIKGFSSLICNTASGHSNIVQDIKDTESLNVQFENSSSMGIGILNGMLLFASLFNIALIVLNLIPLPIFDGGRILISICEMVIGHSINSKIMNVILWCSIFVLIVFEIYVNI